MRKAAAVSRRRPGGLRLAPVYGGMTALIALLTLALRRVVGDADPADAALTYLLLVLLASSVESLGLGLWTSVVAALGLNYFFLPPIGTLTVANPANWFALVAFLVTAIVTSQLVARARLGRSAAEERERLTESLLALSDAAASSLAKVAAQAPDGVTRDLARACADSTRASACLLDIRVPLAARAVVGDPERLHAEALRAGEVVAPRAPERFSDVGEEEATWILPLGPGGGVAGALALAVASGGPSDSRAAVEATARLASIAIERAWLARAAAAAEAARQGEEFKSVLLSGVSHELRTPIASIRLAATALMRPEVWRDGEARAELLDALDQEAARLNARVGSLLAMSRLESGAVSLDLVEVDAGEIAAAALRHVGLSATDRRLRVTVAAGLAPVRADVTLLAVALANLIDNALKYGPQDGVVEVAVEADRCQAGVAFRVADRGPGLSVAERERVFARFYRDPVARRGPTTGSGLGLSIARALTEAHGGSVQALARDGGGSIFVLALPRRAAGPGPGPAPADAMPGGGI